MAPMITAGLTIRGKPNYREKNNFSYVFDGKRAETLNSKKHALVLPR